NQAVKARVLGVDRARRRISLSLRPDRSAPSARPAEGGERVAGTPGDKVRLDDIPGTRGERRRGIGSERGRAATGANRAQALRDLENLFKKK
ncbi:MAG: putative RNA-binding protein with RPS1 domain, partial [Bradymonadia bacterium]